jgi:hypothetical protein
MELHVQFRREGNCSHMLQIRQAQMDVFRTQPRLAFERQLAGYLKRYFPFEAANSDLERWVRAGLESAARFGLLLHHECAMYLALTAMLGAGFSEDPQIPWAHETMFSPNELPMDRIARVYEKGIEYLDATGGPKCSWFVRAKIRVRQQDMTALDHGVHRRAWAERIEDLLVRMYPQKAGVVGEKAMKQLVKSAIARAEQRGAKSAQPALIHATHMYYLGSEFDRDPCYPWAGAALADDSVESVEGRYARMHRLSLDYLDRSFQFKG